MKVEKVHLETLMKALMVIYHQGVEYVDIEYKDDKNGEPSVFLSYKDEYLIEDEASVEDDVKEPDEPSLIPPSVDFNDLI